MNETRVALVFLLSLSSSFFPLYKSGMAPEDLHQRLHESGLILQSSIYGHFEAMIHFEIDLLNMSLKEGYNLENTS